GAGGGPGYPRRGDKVLVEDLARLLRRAEAGEEVFGERLLILGSGPLPIPRAVGAAVALDAAGGLVLIAGFSVISSATAAPAERHLADLGRLSEDQLAEEVGAAATTRSEILERHRSFFGHADEHSVTLNESQRLIAVAGQEPSVVAAENLTMTLGPRLGRVLLHDDGVLREIDASALLRPVSEASAAPVEPEARGSRVSTWLAGVAILLGLALVAAGLYRGFQPPDEADPAGDVTVESPVRTIVSGAPATATSTFLNGHRRIVRASSGQLIAVYPAPSGLQVVTDQNNQGRTWRSPTAVAEITAVSVAAAVDEDDRVHLVFSDGAKVSYAILTRGEQGWTAGGSLVIDPASASPVIDIAWDRDAGLAHVVWVQETEGSEQPMWASVVEGRRGRSRMAQTALLADPASETGVLVNVACDRGSRVVATFRSAEAGSGYQSRIATAAPAEGDETLTETGVPKPPEWTWAPPETVSTSSEIAGATLALDRTGTAHLVLRDDDAPELAYYNKTASGGWTQGETAVEAEEPQQIDSPSVSIDSLSRLVYVFFQTGGASGQPEIALAIRDPASGWEGPYAIAAPEDVPDGSMFPAALENAQGQAIVLWTTGGSPPALQAARVTAP
ncbi:MAG: hypothetical protein M3345_06680, partial [Actinomycetota bacterium]|nr:hypothetical protein [Actinomycetota bacterium]